MGWPVFREITALLHHLMWNATTCFCLQFNPLTTARYSSGGINSHGLCTKPLKQRCAVLLLLLEDLCICIQVFLANAMFFDSLCLIMGLMFSSSRSHSVPRMFRRSVISQIIHCIIEESGIDAELLFVFKNSIRLAFIVSTEVWILI